jgi:sulfoxide reductase heme-binding subunit YedZ
MSTDLAAPLISGSTWWYLSRASGFVSLTLFTTVMALGLLTAGRVATPRWPRFVIEGLHRNLSLAAVAFVFVHALTLLADEYVQIGVLDVFVPFISGYLPFWLGLGALAFDVLLTLVITSLLRVRMSHRAWRLVHWLAYAGWPVALAHMIGIGTDRVWVLAAVSLSLLVVLGCGAYRLAGWRRVAMGRPAGRVP